MLGLALALVMRSSECSDIQLSDPLESTRINPVSMEDSSAVLVPYSACMSAERRP